MNVMCSLPFSWQHRTRKKVGEGLGYMVSTWDCVKLSFIYFAHIWTTPTSMPVFPYESDNFMRGFKRSTSIASNPFIPLLQIKDVCYTSLGRCPFNQRLSCAETALQTLPTSQQLKETTAHTCRCLIRVSIPMSSALRSLSLAKRSRRDLPDLPFPYVSPTSYVLCARYSCSVSIILRKGILLDFSKVQKM